MRTCSCFRVTTLLPLLSLALTAVGWSAYNVTEKGFCALFALSLSGSCNDSYTFAMRAITLASWPISSSACGYATNQLLTGSATLREQCCRHRSEDTSVTYHLPSNRSSLPSPYKELADKCFQTPDQCDLYGIAGVDSGKIPAVDISITHALTHVVVSYSCIRNDTVLSFTGSGNLTAPVVSLRQDERTPASSQCLFYSHSCDVTIKLGIIDVNVHDPCTLTLDDGFSRVNDTFPCNSSLQLPLSSSSNFLTVSLHFAPSSGHKQVVWVEAKGSDESPITVACGTSAPALKSVLCTTTTTTTTTTPTTTVATTTPTTTKSPITSSQGTSAKTSIVVPSGTASPATQDTRTVGLAAGLSVSGVVLAAVILLVVYLCKRKPNRVGQSEAGGQRQWTTQEDTPDTSDTKPGPASNPALRQPTGQRHNQLPSLFATDQTEKASETTPPE